MRVFDTGMNSWQTVAHITILVAVPATSQGLSRVCDIICCNMRMYHSSMDMRELEHEFLSEFARSANEVIAVARERSLSAKQVNTFFHRWYHTMWRMRFLFHIFPVNQPTAQVVWDYCQRQFILGLLGKKLDISSDGALVLKHFDADPFGMQAGVLRQTIRRPAAASAPTPAPVPQVEH